MAISHEDDPAFDVPVYDHVVAKPQNGGLAILASLLFLGGGQLVKGHYRRFFALWGVLIGLGALTIGLALLLPKSVGGTWFPVAAGVAFGCLWIYQLFDAAVRP